MPGRVGARAHRPCSSSEKSCNGRATIRTGRKISHAGFPAMLIVFAARKLRSFRVNRIGAFDQERAHLTPDAQDTRQSLVETSFSCAPTKNALAGTTGSRSRSITSSTLREVYFR